MLTIKVRKSGDGLAMILPPEALGRLGAKVGDTLVLTDLPNGFLLTVDPEQPNPEQLPSGETDRNPE